VRRIFFELQEAWGGIPFEVVNDGEVTALAGSMALNDNAVLGVAFGSSLAAGYVTPHGNITGWLNELAFVPVDYRENAPADEWSGDEGIGAQYFSQQAVGRLLPAARIELPKDMPLAAKLVEVQKLMAAGDHLARKIYRTIGTFLGYGVAHFADFYEIRYLLVLGRVMTGEGGDLILSVAGEVLQEELQGDVEGIGWNVAALHRRGLEA
jgi:predicted NBD/HSP70 family sugar kinase